MDISRLDGHSLDTQAPVLARLMADMPELFSEGKLDPEKLKAALGDDAFAGQEQYGLTWNGKSECRAQARETTTKTLRPCRDESVGFDTTENLFIEGDNLQVLKVLQRSYYGKVKMIYIDPPYNSGRDLIYNDKFSRSPKEELMASGSIDEKGNVINHDLYRQNTRDSGHFHSNWLNMMYPRLCLAKSLLRPDGIIFVSIDDNEVKNLRAMLDEIFGEDNFVGQLIWQSKKGGGSDNNQVVKEHEYLLCFVQDHKEAGLAKIELEAEELNLIDDAGHYRRGRELNKWGANSRRQDRPTMYFSVPGPNGEDVYPIRNDGTDGCWRWGKKKMLEIAKRGDVEFIRRDNGTYILYEKIRTKDPRFKPYRTLINDVGTTADGSKLVRDMFGAKVFDFPKPLGLLKKLVEIGAVVANDIIMDFFAGSATTAHAVMELNAEDGGNRRWICVQLPEKCKPDTEAAKAGFVTIADIAKERIRRAGRKIREENADKQLDTGFKVFKLDESNFKVWDTRVDGVAQLEQQLLDFVDNVRPGAQNDDLLYELILKTGLELNVAIEAKEAGGGVYHRIGNGSLVICLADKLTEPLLAAMLGDKPEKIIVLDRAFTGNDQLKTNMLLQAEQAGVKEFTVI